MIYVYKKAILFGFLMIFGLFLTACDQETTVEVTFVDYDGTELKTETVNEFEDATPPEDPFREGFQFSGWDGNYENVEEDVSIEAMYDGLEAIIESIKATDYYYEAYDAYIDGELYQTSELKILEDRLYLSVENVGEYAQELYLSEDNGEYVESVVHPQADCYIENDLENIDYLNVRRGLPNHVYLPAHLDIDWFDQDGEVFTLQEAHFSELAEIFGPNLRAYTLSVTASGIEMDVTFVSDETEYRQTIMFEEDQDLSIDIDAFQACDYQTQDNLEYIALDDGILLHQYVGEETTFHIPNEIADLAVKEIGFFAFSSNDTLKHIVLPNSIERIGPWAFSGMPELESIYIPSSVEQIDEHAFRGSSGATIYVANSSPGSLWHDDYIEDDQDVIFDYEFNEEDFTD